MRMILSRRFPADSLALDVRTVGGEVQRLVHCEQNSPLHRFQAVAHIGQGAGRNDRQGIIQIPLARLLADRNVLDVYSVAGVASRSLVLSVRPFIPFRHRVLPSSEVMCRASFDSRGVGGERTFLNRARLRLTAKQCRLNSVVRCASLSRETVAIVAILLKTRRLPE
jgi:hypothetical protein